jgi:hypothetical protein
MRSIRIYLTDFGGGFDPERNLFSDILRKQFQLEITPVDPEIVIYSNHGRSYLQYDCLRIFFIGENVRPNYSLCDFSFSFDYLADPRNYRLPLYVFFGDMHQLTEPKDPDRILAEKTRFCNFIYSNARAKERIEFFHLLNEYKRVDSAGKVLNNLGYVLEWGVAGNEGKLKFIRPFKFTMAFENASYPGYTTEKLVQPMLANSLAIHWGNPIVGRDFNTKSFINVHDYSSFEEAVDAIIKIDQDDALYKQYMSQPYFPDNKIPENLLSENILNQFSDIIDELGTLRPVSSTLKGKLRGKREQIEAYMLKGQRVIRRLVFK